MDDRPQGDSDHVTWEWNGAKLIGQFCLVALTLRAHFRLWGAKFGMSSTSKNA